jgi:uncharacterized protein (TIGR02147 family)
MNIFRHDDYKAYVNERVRQMPDKGQFRKIAHHLGVQASLISQIFRGDKDLTPEQASLLASYLGLSEPEADYLLTLVSLARAGNDSLRKLLRKRARQLRESASEPAPVEGDRPLSDHDKAIFYSNWFYSAIRQATFVPALDTADAIAAQFRLPRDVVRQVLEFLLSTGLCVRESGGPDKDRLRAGPRTTVLDSDSPFRSRHHSNWRLRAMEKIVRSAPHELFFTCPMSISAADALRIRDLLRSAIDQVDQVADHTRGERVACLNIDWFDA